MSLGGIAIALGMAVDADLVALEACHRRLEAGRRRERPASRRGGADRGRRIVRAGDPDVAGDRRARVHAGVRVRRRVRAAAAAAGDHEDPGDRGGRADHADGGARAARSPAPRQGSARRWRTRSRALLVRAYRPFVHFALSRPGVHAGDRRPGRAVLPADRRPTWAASSCRASTRGRCSTCRRPRPGITPADADQRPGPAGRGDRRAPGGGARCSASRAAPTPRPTPRRPR